MSLNKVYIEDNVFTSTGMDCSVADNLSTMLREAVSKEGRDDKDPLYPFARAVVIKAGKTVFDGTSNADGFEKPEEDSLFRMYSMTKIITSVAIMILVERGLIQLTDPLGKYIRSFRNSKVYVRATAMSEAPDQLQEFGIKEVPTSLVTEEPKQPITIQHLLTHTSGLGYGALGLPFGIFDNVDVWYITHNLTSVAISAGGAYEESSKHATLESIVEELAKMPLKFHPGTKWEYGAGHFVCGRVIEVVTGKSFQQFMKEEIFDPLDMTSAGFGVSLSKNSKLLPLYSYGPEEKTGFSADYTKLTTTGDILDYNSKGYLVPTGSTMEETMHVDFCKREKFITAVNEYKGPFGGDSMSTMTVTDYLKFATMLVNKGIGANGKRILSKKMVEMCTKNYLPDNKSIGEMEHDVNNIHRPLISTLSAVNGIGFGLLGAVGIADRHQTIDGSIALQDQCIHWFGFAGTDVIIDLKEDMIILFATQVVCACWNSDYEGCFGAGRYAKYAYQAIL